MTIHLIVIVKLYGLLFEQQILPY